MHSFTILNKLTAHTPHPSKFVRMMRVFDGSVTQLVQSISNQQMHIQLLSNSKVNEIPNPLSQCQLQGQMVERVVKFILNKQVIGLARSYWKSQVYNDIIKKDENQPFGLILIKHRVEKHSEIRWVGECEIECGDQRWKDIQGRSYVGWIKGSPAFYLQEFFLPSFFNLLQK